MTVAKIGKIAVTLLLVAASTASAQTAGSAKAAKPTIVLVHGAFADASSFDQLIPLLFDAGYNVVAVQNPLTSLQDDIATGVRPQHRTGESGRLGRGLPRLLRRRLRRGFRCHDYKTNSHPFRLRRDNDSARGARQSSPRWWMKSEEWTGVTLGTD